MHQAVSAEIANGAALGARLINGSPQHGSSCALGLHDGITGADWSMMNSYRTILLLIIVAAWSGCNVCYNVRRTLFLEPHQYPTCPDRKESLQVYHEWAECAWIKEARACGRSIAHDDYALGFIDGFVQYVYAGGSTEPPPVPPRQFWNVEMRQPGGHVAAQQWFDGYRHGARFAQDHGYRERVTIHSSYRSSPWGEDWNATPLGTDSFIPEESVLPQANTGSPGPELLPPGTESLEEPEFMPDATNSELPSLEESESPTTEESKPSEEALPKEDDLEEQSSILKNPRQEPQRSRSGFKANQAGGDEAELNFIGRQLDGYYKHQQKKPISVTR